MRYVIYGAGAVGCAIAGRLHQHGGDVVLIARGAQLAALRDSGLRLLSPDDDLTLAVPVVGSPAEVDFGAGEVVILAVKTQHTQGALDELRLAAPHTTPVVCAQNGVENERLALRCFARVYGMVVTIYSQYLEPGTVELSLSPVGGVLDVGRVPSGADEVAITLATDLEHAGFSSRAVDDIMRWKHTKLIRNLTDSARVLCGDADVADVRAAASAEAVACLDAAGIPYLEDAAYRERVAVLPSQRPAQGRPRGGSSGWQSLARGTGSVEADYTNGAITLLGRLHGVATPVNAALQELMNRLAAASASPGTVDRATLDETIRRHTAA